MSKIGILTSQKYRKLQISFFSNWYFESSNFAFLAQNVKKIIKGHLPGATTSHGGCNRPRGNTSTRCWGFGDHIPTGTRRGRCSRCCLASTALLFVRGFSDVRGTFRRGLFSSNFAPRFWSLRKEDAAIASFSPFPAPFGTSGLKVRSWRKMTWLNWLLLWKKSRNYCMGCKLDWKCNVSRISDDKKKIREYCGRFLFANATFLRKFVGKIRII